MGVAEYGLRVRKSRGNTQKLFAQNLRRIRKARGLSQERLAELADLARETISEVEREKVTISLRSLDRIAVALNCESYELLKLEN